MKSLIGRFNRFLYVFMVLSGIACAFPAQAAYKYTLFEFPGSLCGQVWGINDFGNVVGNAAFAADCSGPVFSYIYNSRTRAFTVLPTVPGAVSTAGIGINWAGVVVGSAGDTTLTADVGFVLKNGGFTFFSNPGWPNTQARAISALGLVTGYSSDSAGNSAGFIYIRANQTFTNFLPSSFTIAQGINTRGQVVGNVRLDADGAYVGSPPGTYGFLRDWSGAIRLFGVASGFDTRARGITDWGRITGFFRDSVTGNVRGFVATPSNASGFQSLTIPAGDLLDVPDAVDTIPEGINNFGVVSGSWTDAAGAFHGFLATPLRRERDD